jgi:hypothetical protein
MREKARITFVFATFLVLLPACERGCLMKAARDHGVTPSTSAPTPIARGQDCAPDLVRCQHGSLMRSLGGFVPESCAGSVEQCSCPWTPAGQCQQGCIVDDLEVTLAADAGPTQLCVGASAAIVGGAMPDGVACDEDREIVCQKSAVVRCERPLRLLATCTHSCALSELPAETDDRAAIALACRR